MRHVACNNDACDNKGAPYTMEHPGSPPCPVCATPMDAVVLEVLLATQEAARVELAVLEELERTKPPVAVVPEPKLSPPVVEMPDA